MPKTPEVSTARGMKWWLALWQAYFTLLHGKPQPLPYWWLWLLVMAQIMCQDRWHPKLVPFPSSKVLGSPHQVASHLLKKGLKVPA